MNGGFYLCISVGREDEKGVRFWERIFMYVNFEMVELNLP